MPLFWQKMNFLFYARCTYFTMHCHPLFSDTKFYNKSCNTVISHYFCLLLIKHLSYLINECIFIRSQHNGPADWSELISRLPSETTQDPILANSIKKISCKWELQSNKTPRFLHVVNIGYCIIHPDSLYTVLNEV